MVAGSELIIRHRKVIAGSNPAGCTKYYFWRFVMITGIWSYRHTVARGYDWKLERECHVSESVEWLNIFKKDEPNVQFILSNKKPK